LAVFAFGDVGGPLLGGLVLTARVPGGIAAGGLRVEEGDRFVAPFAGSGHFRPPPPEEPDVSWKPAGSAGVVPGTRTRLRRRGSHATVCRCHPALRPGDRRRTSRRIHRSEIDRYRSRALG
jgi:hypothetical protein